MRRRNKIQREAEKHGLLDPPITLEFETEGTVRRIDVACDECGKELGPVWMTVFVEDYTDRDCQLDLVASHKWLECPGFRHRFRRWTTRQRDRILRLFRRKYTPWGIKHINWKPNYKQEKP